MEESKGWLSMLKHKFLNIFLKNLVMILKYIQIEQLLSYQLHLDKYQVDLIHASLTQFQPLENKVECYNLYKLNYHCKVF